MSDVEAASRAVVEGIEAIDPEFVLYLPSSTLKLVLQHFLDGPGAKPSRRVFPIPHEEEASPSCRAWCWRGGGRR